MSIRRKLTFIILGLVAIPLLFVSVIAFISYENSLRSARLSQLQNLADFKAEQIETYFAGRWAEIEMAQSFFIIRKHMPLLTRSAGGPDNPAAAAAREVLDNQLRRIQASARLSDVILTDNNGRIVYASDSGQSATVVGESLPEIQPISFKDGSTGIFFSDIYFNKSAGNRLEMRMTAPAFDLNDAPVGFIVFELNMATFYRQLLDTTGLGRTGEVLIGKRYSPDKLLFLNPLRHDPAAALKRSVRVGDSAGQPLQKALQGETGSGTAVDYRGRMVFAAWRPIPSIGWGLVAKIDSDEALHEVTHLRHLVLMILAVIFIMVTLITLSVSLSISLPIKNLTKGVAIIGSGNLTHSVGTRLKDEIGHLSRAFDRMTHDLRTTIASRDELNREIAERKRVETSLREREKMLKRAQEIARLGSWELDVHDNKLTWSDEVYRIFGTVPGEFPATYEAFLNAVHPDDRGAVNEAYSTSLREARDMYEIEHRVVRISDNEVRFVHEKCEHVRDESGRIIRSVGMVHDITERKAAEEALRRAKEEWERTFDSVPDLIALMDSNHRIVRVNRAMANRMGVSTHEAIGTRCYQCVHGTEAPPSDCPHEMMLRDNKEHTEEIHEERLGGDFLISTTPLFDLQGKLIGSVHVARDITARKKAEEQLKRLSQELEKKVEARTAELKGTNELLRLEIIERAKADESLAKRQQVLESIYAIETTYSLSLEDVFDQVVVTVSNLVNLPFAAVGRIEKGRISVLSQFTDRNLSREKQVMPATHPCGIIVNAKNVQWYSCDLGKKFPGQMTALDTKFRSYIGVPIFNKDGATIGVICAMGLVERRFSELELHSIEIIARYVGHEIEHAIMDDQLRTAGEMNLLGRIASGVAHEVRNPLNGILAISEALFQDLGDRPEHQPYLQHIKNQVNRLASLMRDLLDLGKPLMQSNFTPLPLDQIIISAIESLKHSPSHKHRSVIFTPTKGSFQVKGDSVKLSQVFFNIIDNACDHSPESEPVTIEMTGIAQIEAVVRVIDKGKGIPPDLLEKVFEPFFSTRKGGTGLGLSIVNRIVELHGGTVSIVYNVPGPGLTVEVQLPFCAKSGHSA